MTPTVQLSDDLLKEKFTSAPAYRGQYLGDIDDCPTGDWIIRQDAENANLPIPGSGHLHCVRGACGIQQFTTSAAPVRTFVRTRWYSNNWGKWHEHQLIKVSLGGGKSLFFNLLRNLAERRAA